MKISAAFPTMLALLLALAPAVRTHAQDAPQPTAPGANFDLFYNNLADDGDWYNTPGYGYVWHPYVADKSNTWRPYTDGYWAQTEDGWTWVSYESFGWATYHYGRWTRLNDLGWAWVPGYDWGPGWVSWRTNNDYVGWAPLPPQQESVGFQASVGAPGASFAVDYNDVEDVSQGYTPAVDANFDIGPQNYCFVACTNFGAPVLSAVLLPPQQNIVILQNTVNVTNIYYGNQSGQTVVYNRGGPDYAFISTRVTQPIQRLQIQANTNPGYLSGNHPAGFNPTQVHNGVLQVAAPMIAHGPVNFQQVKPPRVKATLAKAEVVRGWSGAAGDPQAIQRAREQIKQQAQAVPKRQPNGNIAMPARPTSNAPVAEGRERQPTAPNAAANAAPRPALTPAERPARPEQRAPAAATPAPAAVATKPAVPADADRAARSKAAHDQDRAAHPAEPAVAQPTARPESPREAQPAPRAEEHTPAPREEQHTAAPREEPRATEAKPAERPEAKPAERPEAEHEARPTPAPREEPRAPEPKAATPRPSAERAEPKPTAAHEDRAAKPDAAHRDETAKQRDDDKKKKDQPPQ